MAAGDAADEPVIGQAQPAKAHTDAMPKPMPTLAFERRPNVRLVRNTLILPTQLAQQHGNGVAMR